MFRIESNKNTELVLQIREKLKQNDFYCPCALEKTEDTKCICKDMRENVAVGDYCHCGLYKLISR